MLSLISFSSLWAEVTDQNAERVRPVIPLGPSDLLARPMASRGARLHETSLTVPQIHVILRPVSETSCVPFCTHVGGDNRGGPVVVLIHQSSMILEVRKCGQA